MSTKISNTTRTKVIGNRGTTSAHAAGRVPQVPPDRPHAHLRPQGNRRKILEEILRKEKNKERRSKIASAIIQKLVGKFGR